MVKSILAIAAAATCAGLVVLAPEFAPKSAMAATQSGEAGAPMQADVVAKKSNSQTAAARNTGHTTNKAVFATRACRVGLSEWFVSSLSIAPAMIE